MPDERGVASHGSGSPEWVDAYLGMGANVGTDAEKLKRLRDALKALSAHPQVRIKSVSSAYETPPWGVEDQPAFINAVCCIETCLAPEALLSAIKALEVDLGRLPRERWGPREIDLDILLYGDLSVASANLTVPHPGLLERSFVVIPLLEIAPLVRLPDGRTVREAVSEHVLSDRSAGRLKQSIV